MTAVSIHAMWLMEENAIILRREVWLIPVTEPTTAERRAAIIIVMWVWSYVDKSAIKERGAIFWMVIKIISWGHNKLSMIWGNQKWKGAAPSFNRRAEIIITNEILGWNSNKDLLKMIRDDPKAWIKKYLMAASDK